MGIFDKKLSKLNSWGNSSDYWNVGEIGNGTFDSEIESMKQEVIRDRRYFGCEDERA